MMRRAVIGILTTLAVHSAAADPTQQQCVDAYTSAQRLRADGALRAARERLLVCGRDPCPQVMQPDCLSWLKEIEPQIPSIVVRASLRGAEITDVRVLVDGVEVAPRLDGHAIDVDPGKHVLSFEHAGARPESRTVLINQGEQARAIDIVLTPTVVPPPPPPPEEPGGEPRSVYVAGAIGIGALAVGGVFGTWGLVKRSDLATCKPDCGAERTDEVSHRFLAADISYAVGIAALGAAAYFHFTRPSLGLSTQPTPGGAMVSVQSSF